MRTRHGEVDTDPARLPTRGAHSRVMTATERVPMPDANAPCPCGSGKPFGLCCGPLLTGERPAADAEQLMRSRFTAHALRDYRHLHRTYWGTARQPFAEPVGEDDAPKWTRLEVHHHEPGSKPATALVDFTAWFDDHGVERPLQEKSEFAQIDGLWYYTRALRTGPAPIKAAPKVGRNDPCPCGSGKKFKQCCGR